jgi:hypothetical protein
MQHIQGGNGTGGHHSHGQNNSFTLRNIMSNGTGGMHVINTSGSNDYGF